VIGFFGPERGRTPDDSVSKSRAFQSKGEPLALEHVSMPAHGNRLRGLPRASWPFRGILLALALVAPADPVCCSRCGLASGSWACAIARLPAEFCSCPLVLPWPACRPAAWLGGEARTSQRPGPTSARPGHRWGLGLVCRSLESTGPSLLLPFVAAPVRMLFLLLTTPITVIGYLAAAFGALAAGV